MSYFDNTSPADTDAVKKGASKIRSIQTALNTLISQIWDDTGAFLTGWITSSMFGAGSVNTAAIEPAAVTTAAIAPGALSVDSPGRAIMADGYIEAGKLASDFTLPGAAIAAATITTAMIQAGAVTDAQIAEGTITLDKLISPNLFSKVYLGTFSVPQPAINNVGVSIPGINPDFVILFSATRTASPSNGFAGIAFRSSAVSGYSGALVSKFRSFAGLDTYNSPISAPFDPLHSSCILWSGSGFTVQVYDFTFASSINSFNGMPGVSSDSTFIYLAVVV